MNCLFFKCPCGCPSNCNLTLPNRTNKPPPGFVLPSGKTGRQGLQNASAVPVRTHSDSPTGSPKVSRSRRMRRLVDGRGQLRTKPGRPSSGYVQKANHQPKRIRLRPLSSAPAVTVRHSVHTEIAEPRVMRASYAVLRDKSCWPASAI